MLEQNICVGLISMNELESIHDVLSSIRRVLPKAEIVLVDSSDDETPIIAASYGAKVIRQYPPQGYGPAMMRLLKECNKEVIITLDCDNTYPVEEIPHLAQLILEGGYDIVDASRLNQKPQAMPWLNYIANRGFAIIASWLFKYRFLDLHSGMRAYRKSMLEQLSFEGQGAALPVELLIKPLLFGYKLGIHPISYQERLGDSKMQPWETVWWTIKRLVRLHQIKV
jgi:glycosyltransferase involved in cell wall biosynthesis